MLKIVTRRAQQLKEGWVALKRGDDGGVQRSFVIAPDEYEVALAHRRAHGVEITFEEDRQGGVFGGPACLFSRS